MDVAYVACLAGKVLVVVLLGGVCVAGVALAVTGEIGRSSTPTLLAGAALAVATATLAAVGLLASPPAPPRASFGPGARSVRVTLVVSPGRLEGLALDGGLLVQPTGYAITVGDRGCTTSAAAGTHTCRIGGLRAGRRYRVVVRSLHGRSVEGPARVQYVRTR